MLMKFLYIPQFSETLPKEMLRRRLALFTLTPNVLMFNPRHPKAVRNTIGNLQPRILNFFLQPGYLYFSQMYAFSNCEIIPLFEIT